MPLDSTLVTCSVGQIAPFATALDENAALIGWLRLLVAAQIGPGFSGSVWLGGCVMISGGCGS
jgi:hypothetical protein